MSAEPNGEFSFRCFDCGSYVESWHLAEMLDFSDRHATVCDGKTETES